MWNMLKRLGGIVSAALAVLLGIGGLVSIVYLAAKAGTEATTAVFSAVGLEGRVAKALGVLVGIVSLLAIPTLIVAPFKLKRHLGRRPWRRLRSALGFGYSISDLATRLELEAAKLHVFEPKYSSAFIPKRNGGTRRLLIPDAATKDLQRRILRRLLGRLKVHNAAHAYERGRSVATNAALHSRRQVVLKIDLKDFFDRTSAQRVEAYFRRIGWNRDAAALITRLVTTEGGLPQGAPTSPRLANLVNISLDRNITRTAARYNGTYTRYADDITISFPEDWPRKLLKVIHRVKFIAMGCGYEIHDGRKLGVYRQHQRQRVCGVVVNAKPALPRETRRRLRAVEHALKVGKPATMTPSQLSGWRAYERSLSLVQVSEWKTRPRRKGMYRHADEPISPKRKGAGA